MSSLKAQFDKAAQDVQKLSRRPSDKDLLLLYGLFKQATSGDVSGPKPGMLDFKGKAKYESWSKRRGTPKNDAMEEYVATVKRLQKADS